MKNDKRLVITFERRLAEFLAKGVDRQVAERTAMCLALQDHGWTPRESADMTERIFASKEAMKNRGSK